MPFNGSGVYTLPRDMTDDDDAGIPIVASNFDEQFVDIRDAINNSLTRDGQGAASANLPMNTFRHTNVGSAVARTDYARTDQVQDGAFTVVNSASITGNAALGGTVSPAIGAYRAGQHFQYTVSAGIVPASTSATLNINGVGATQITYRDGSTLQPGDWSTGVYFFVYNADIGRFEIVSAPQASSTRRGLARIATTAEMSSASASGTGVVIGVTEHGPIIASAAIVSANVIGLIDTTAVPVYYRKHGRTVTITVSGIVGTGASTFLLLSWGSNITGPAIPIYTHSVLISAANTGEGGYAFVSASGITFNKFNNTAFTSGDNRGFRTTVISWTSA